MKKFIQRYSIEAFAVFMLFALGVQFLFGMYTNLFVDFPEDILGWITIHNNFAPSVHLYLGASLSLAAVLILAAAIVRKIRYWLVVSIVGITGIMIAILNGVAFAGEQNDANSFFMSVGFTVAILSYAYGLFISARKDKKQII